MLLDEQGQWTKTNHRGSFDVTPSMPVVLKVVDTDPQGSIGLYKGSMNSHGVTEWLGGQ